MSLCIWRPRYITYSEFEQETALQFTKHSQQEKSQRPLESKNNPLWAQTNSSSSSSSWSLIRIFRPLSWLTPRRKTSAPHGGWRCERGDRPKIGGLKRVALLRFRVFYIITFWRKVLGQTFTSVCRYGSKPLKYPSEDPMSSLETAQSGGSFHPRQLPVWFNKTLKATTTTIKNIQKPWTWPPKNV